MRESQHITCKKYSQANPSDQRHMELCYACLLFVPNFQYTQFLFFDNTLYEQDSSQLQPRINMKRMILGKQAK